MSRVKPFDPDAKQPILWRGWLLYLLPLPLLPATLSTLGDGDLVKTLARGAGLALILGGASFIRRGIRLDNEAIRRNLRRRASTVRYRLIGAGMASVGTFLVAWLGIAARHGVLGSLLIGLAVLLGCYLYYDFDDPTRRPDIAAVGITTEELVELLDEAEGRIQRIESDAARINNTEFRDRLRRIAVEAVLIGAAVLLGCYLYYDFDDPVHRPDIAATGITTEELVALLDEAEGRIQRIEADAARINNTEFRDRLRRIAAEAREILATIERDPVDARRARKFLKVYLDGAQQVTEGYARTHRGENTPALEDNFRRVLGTIETVIAEQQAKLAENNAADLDVKIEVLQLQLEREGVV